MLKAGEQLPQMDSRGEADGAPEGQSLPPNPHVSSPGAPSVQAFSAPAPVSAKRAPAAPGPDMRNVPAPPPNPPDVRPQGVARPRLLIRRVVLLAVLVAALGTVGYFGTYWWTTGRYLVWTDDAYVGAYTTTLAAKISGYVTSVAVDDNTHVHAGDLIATIDGGDYQLAVETARDKVATQQATIARIVNQVSAQEAMVAQARAQLASARAAATRMQLELTRQQALANRDFASKQTLEQALANRDQASAAVESAKAAVDTALANVDVFKGQQQEAVQQLKEQQTGLAKAERDLSFAVIRAPFDGVIGNRGVHTGDYVQPGQRLASLVPLDAVYVDANFKEMQLAKLHPGQSAKIKVDAVPDRTFVATVVSFAPASGSVFSLLPPDNATGNFTKIVQRVPVRLQLPPTVAHEGVLRPGMSVVVTVNTRPGTATDEPLAAR
jgi:membrane fusion protein (multidrug efflux system)